MFTIVGPSGFQHNCCFLSGGGGAKARDHQREERSEEKQELGSKVNEDQEIHQLQVWTLSEDRSFVCDGSRLESMLIRIGHGK